MGEKGTEHAVERAAFEPGEVLGVGRRRREAASTTTRPFKPIRYAVPDLRPAQGLLNCRSPASPNPGTM